MAVAHPRTFVVDCPDCKAKVVAPETGRAERFYYDDDAGEPFGRRVHVGNCPKCRSILVGESNQVGFEGIDSDKDEWNDPVRVYPRPAKTFSSWRIPKVVLDSLSEAERCLQVGANIAACVMLGRALEGLSRDMLTPAEINTTKPKKPLMLGAAIKQLRDRKIIDDRLFDWSQQLQAFRNLAAHPEDITISRHDAEDLQSFVNAIVEYVYDLADRYDEFKIRLAAQEQKRKKHHPGPDTASAETP